LRRRGWSSWRAPSSRPPTKANKSQRWTSASPA
jgi:hypothetical protein